MNYTELYNKFFTLLLYSREEGVPSIMYPPHLDMDEVEYYPNLTDEIATVIFTTGTTGKPKGVIHTRESIDSAIKSNTKLLGITKDDVLMNFLPTWTIGTYIYTVPTYLQGGKIIHDKFTPEGFQEYLKQKPTITLLIPTMLDMMKESGLEFDLSSLRNVGVGAEEVKEHHLEYVLELGAKSVTHMYGSSEGIPLSLYNTFYNKEDITLGLKEVDGFKYDNKESLFLSGKSVSKSYVGDYFGDWYDSKDNFIIKDGLYFWQKRTDNIVKKKGWKAVMEREFEIYEKEFLESLDPSTLTWHKDKGDREVTILETGGNWKFEAENKEPLVLKEGDVVYVSKTTLHKIHKGDGNLKVSIKEYK